MKAKAWLAAVCLAPCALALLPADAPAAGPGKRIVVIPILDRIRADAGFCGPATPSCPKELKQFKPGEVYVDFPMTLHDPKGTVIGGAVVPRDPATVYKYLAHLDPVIDERGTNRLFIRAYIAPGASNFVVRLTAYGFYTTPQEVEAAQ